MANDSGLSACIITFNEADRIDACLRSLDFCDEIIVVDSHSTDRTREIAAARGARVIERDWPGYRTQKQFAVDAACHDWVLCLDADERVSAQLREEIIALRGAGLTAAAGWSMPRITEYFGHFLRHGNAYPDRLVRLFDRRRGGGRAMRSTRTPASTALSSACTGISSTTPTAVSTTTWSACSATRTSWRGRCTTTAGAADSRRCC